MMSAQLTIRGRRIANDTSPYVIAEVGANHQGDLSKCKQLFREAKAVGVDAVKLQKRSNRSLYTAAYYNSRYDSPNSFGRTYGEHREALEFDRDAFLVLRDYAESLDIAFFATPFDWQSADLLAELEVPAFKVTSADIRSHSLLRHIAAYGKPMVLSTGGATLEHIRAALAIVRPYTSEIALLQCTAAYPATDEVLDLSVIETFKSEFPEAVVGFSGHDTGVLPSILAIALGARVLEKHFTLDKQAKGSDHGMSLEPHEMALLVEAARRYPVARGDGQKVIYPVELPAMIKMGKKVVAARDLRADERITREDLELRSPGDGMSPELLECIVGRYLLRDIRQGEDLRQDDFGPVPKP